MVKKGDTLIEVTLAVGIFSMVAVAVVAVMSNGTSNTQTALETTLARAEIDAQAEALRFIQSSAATEDPNAIDSKFSGIWNKIISMATDTKSGENYHFAPTSCTELYDSSDGGKIYIANQNAFFVDLTKLDDYLNEPNKLDDCLNDPKENSNCPIITAKEYPDSFSLAETYPRVVDGKDGKAEGIYVIARKDSKTVQTANDEKVSPYDFYIHTCWNSSNSDRPSTISPVIRLLGKTK